MEAKAFVRHVRVTPRKAGQVAVLVRGKSVADALHVLKWVKKASGPIVEKAVRSAFANLQQKQATVKPEAVRITSLLVDAAGILKNAKRFIPRAMGRASKIRNRTCHISVFLNDQPIKKGS